MPLDYAPPRPRRGWQLVLYLLGYMAWLGVVLYLQVQLFACALDLRPAHSLLFQVVVILALYLWLVALPSVAAMLLESPR